MNAKGGEAGERRPDGRDRLTLKLLMLCLYEMAGADPDTVLAIADTLREHDRRRGDGSEIRALERVIDVRIEGRAPFAAGLHEGNDSVQIDLQGIDTGGEEAVRIVARALTLVVFRLMGWPESEIPLPFTQSEDGSERLDEAAEEATRRIAESVRIRTGPAPVAASRTTQ